MPHCTPSGYATNTHQKHHEENDGPENREGQLQNKIRIGQEDESCVQNRSLLQNERIS